MCLHLQCNYLNKLPHECFLFQWNNACFKWKPECLVVGSSSSLKSFLVSVCPELLKLVLWNNIHVQLYSFNKNWLWLLLHFFAGFYENKPLFFSSKYGAITITLTGAVVRWVAIVNIFTGIKLYMKPTVKPWLSTRWDLGK